MVQNQCARSKITAKETPKSPNESEAEPDLHLSQIQVITRDSEMVWMQPTSQAKVGQIGTKNLPIGLYQLLLRQISRRRDGHHKWSVR